MTRGRTLHKRLRSQGSFGLICVPFHGADTSGHLAPKTPVHLPVQVPREDRIETHLKTARKRAKSAHCEPYFALLVRIQPDASPFFISLQ